MIKSTKLNSMKAKFYFSFIALFCAITFVQPVLANEPATKTEAIADPAAELRIAEIEARVNELKSMDRSSMTRAERKAAKKELKELKKEAKALGGGVYLSVGAIIIIILLLILIL